MIPRQWSKTSCIFSPVYRQLRLRFREGVDTCRVSPQTSSCPGPRPERCIHGFPANERPAAMRQLPP